MSPTVDTAVQFIAFLQDWLQATLVWIRDLGLIGVLVYIAVYVVATVLLIPGSLLTLGGGAIYGVVWGSVYVLLAATLGAIAAFLIGRYLTQAWVERQLANHPTFSAIAEAVAHAGLKIVLLTRLSPIFPFSLLNYAFGITQVSLKDYVLGSVGMIPGTVLYVYIGSLAHDLAMLGTQPVLNPQAEVAQWSIRILGLIATIAVTVYITRIARQALAQTVDPQEATHESPKSE